MSRSLAFVVLVACSPAEPPTATIAPPTATAVASETPQTENASSDYAAADQLVTAGKYAEARAAFEATAKKFPYSRFARDAELRIAQLDEKLGRPEAISELATWAKNHPTDPRAKAIAARAKTVGDTTCVRDDDCTTTTKNDCCACCPSGPYATSKRWLAWQGDQCAISQCASCANRVCGPPDPPAAARCNAGSCELR